MIHSHPVVNSVPVPQASHSQSLPLLPLYIILCGIHFVQQKKKTTISRKMGVVGVTAYQWGAGSFEKYIIL